MISSGGQQYVYGGSYFGTIASGATQYVESGGYVSGTNDAYVQIVFKGGITYFVSALTGFGDQYLSGGTADYTLLSGGGGQYVYSGGLGYETLISSGSFQAIASGGTSLYTYVYSGGFQHIYSGGLGSGTQILYGGVAYTSSDGVDSSTSISNGGVQHVYGSSYGASVESGGIQDVESGGASNSARSISAEWAIPLRAGSTRPLISEAAGFRMSMDPPTPPRSTQAAPKTSCPAASRSAVSSTTMGQRAEPRSSSAAVSPNTPMTPGCSM